MTENLRSDGSYRPLVKGELVYSVSMGERWPAIVLEASRRSVHNVGDEPILCEVFGWEHESGSVWRRELIPANDVLTWVEIGMALGHNPLKQMRYDGPLLIDDRIV